MKRARAVALLRPTPYEDANHKRQVAVLQFVVEHRYELTSLTTDPAAVLALAAAALVDVVVVFADEHALTGVRELVEAAGARYESVIARRDGPSNTRVKQVMAAVARGADPATVALVLGIPEHEVIGIVAAERRPQTRPAPVDRHQVPPDHPWRREWPETAERRARLAHHN